MKWDVEPSYVTENRARAKLKQWHTWFAWRPVTLVDECTRVWLEKVDRRVLYWYGENGHIPVYEYKERK